MTSCWKLERRMRMSPLICLVGAALISVAPSAAAGQVSALASQATIQETTNLASAFHAAAEARLAGPRSRVLLVLDIDNTLLTMPQYLGSDRWFNHHSAEIAANTDPDFSDMGELIATQTALFGMASMKATEPDIPTLLADAERQGVDIFLLSARGPELYDATRRELDRNKLQFDAPYACSFFLCMTDGLYGDREIRAGLVALGEDPSDSPYRNILIRDGMMLAAGQDKGVMLKLLMGAIGGRSYDHVVVADDGRKNIDALAASHNPVPLALFYYRRVATSVTEEENRDARSQLNGLVAALCSALQSALCRQPAADLNEPGK